MHFTLREQDENKARAASVELVEDEWVQMGEASPSAEEGPAGVAGSIWEVAADSAEPKGPRYIFRIRPEIFDFESE